MHACSIALGYAGRDDCFHGVMAGGCADSRLSLLRDSDSATPAPACSRIDMLIYHQGRRDELMSSVTRFQLIFDRAFMMRIQQNSDAPPSPFSRSSQRTGDTSRASDIYASSPFTPAHEIISPLRKELSIIDRGVIAIGVHSRSGRVYFAI